jgi:hypothetical protein
MSNPNDLVLEKLWACVAACDYCADQCLEEEDVAQMTDCIRADRDCSDICTLTARYIARGSKHIKHVLEECIEICNECAAECEKHEHTHCQECAKSCRECIQACQAYAA